MPAARRFDLDLAGLKATLDDGLGQTIEERPYRLLVTFLAVRVAISNANEFRLAGNFERNPIVSDWYPSALRIECLDRKSTRLNSSHLGISYAVFCLKKKNK